MLLPSILNEGRPNPKVDRKKFKGVIPFFSLHHKWAIQYLGGKANSQKNYVGIAEFKSVDDWSNDTPQHDIWHEAMRMANSATATSFMKMFWPAMSKIPILLNIWSIRDMTTKMTGSTGPSVWGIRRKTISAER